MMQHTHTQTPTTPTCCAQEEVAYLNKCLAWSELQQLREEVAEKRQKIEDTAPQQQAEVRAV